MLEMGIPGVCDKWLTLPPNPDIVDIDLLYEAGAGAKRLDISSVSEKARMGAHTGIVLKKTKSYDYASTESPNESLDDTVSLPRSQSDEANSELSEDSRGQAEAERRGQAQERGWPGPGPGEELDTDSEGEENSWSELYRSTSHHASLSPNVFVKTFFPDLATSPL